MPGETISEISNWQLETVEVVSASHGQFDIHVAHLETINIFEGLSEPALTGSITIKDYDGILEIQEIFAGDDINISLKAKGESRSLTFNGKIFAVNQQVSGSQGAPVTVFSFCSNWWFQANTKQVSKVWKNKTIAEMIEEVITVDCEQEDFQGIHPAPSTIIERLVTPNWTPARILKFLLAYLNGDAGESGYVLWESLYWQAPGVYSLGHLLDPAEGGTNYGRSKIELFLNSPNVQYAGNFNNLWVESLYDEMRYLHQGVYQSDIWVFDYDRNKPYKSTGTASDVNSKHLAHQMPIRESSASEKYRSTHKSSMYPNTQKFTTEQDFQKGVDGYRNNRLQMVFSDMIKMSTLLPGDTAREAGEIVKINYPSINKGSGTDTRHKMMEGDYLIRDIQHVLTYSNFVQAITFVKDGINMTTRDDLKKW